MCVDARQFTPAEARRPRRQVQRLGGFSNQQRYSMAGGAELAIEVTRMFASLAVWDKVEARFHIVGVMGPDEYHDRYPDTPGSGLRDNTYINVLVSWLCERAADTMRALDGHLGDDLIKRMSVGAEELSLWSRLGSGSTY